jgi:hypothetical protein
MIATITMGSIIGGVALALLLFVCLACIGVGVLNASDTRTSGYSSAPAWPFIVGGIAAGLVILGCWWWGMAFTLSSDYHAWNVKEGRVEKISKRLVSNGDKGMQERFVFRLEDGQLYGVDDTRASLVESGDDVSLKCKKDYEWGVPREAHGWACKWNRVPEMS